MAGIGRDGLEGPIEAGNAVRVAFPEAMDAPAAVEIADNGAVLIDGRVQPEVLEGAAGRVRLVDPDGTSRGAIVGEITAHEGARRGVQRFEVVVDGWRFEVDLEPERRARLRERATSARDAGSGGGPLELHAIIPGRVVSVDVALGDAIEAGGRLLVVEAMKMQNELRSPRAGTVSRLAVRAGQTVERGDLLLVLE